MKTREGEIGLRIRVMGRVQGVGFRPWACTLAREIGVCGRIWNDAEGVTVEAFGSPDQLSLLRVLLARPTLPAAFVSGVKSDAIGWDDCGRFEIVAGEHGGARRLLAGQRAPLHCARKYVPSPIKLPGRFARPILACGAHLKNTICLAYRNLAWLGPHIGDLETDESCCAFEEAIEQLIRLVGVTPEIVAHDLHPDYHSTRYALARKAAHHIGVQHHHAHIAAACAEHGMVGPVIGLAWDGTGYGMDDTAWGGEALWVYGAQFRRLATFRPLTLAGGDMAIRQVWRIALAALDDAFDGRPPLECLRLFDGVDLAHVVLVRQMIAEKINAPLAHGVGRYFDAVGALLLPQKESQFEGQVAMACSSLVEDSGYRPYPFEVHSGEVDEFDMRPMFRALVQNLIDEVAPAVIAGRFHETMVAVGEAMVDGACQPIGQVPVALSGGCFQNEHLVTGLVRALGPSHRVLRHRLLPPGDGGLALGQAMVADLRVCEAASS